MYSPPLLCTCGWFSSPLPEGNERGTGAAAPKRRGSSGARASSFGSAQSGSAHTGTASEHLPGQIERAEGEPRRGDGEWRGGVFKGIFILPDFLSSIFELHVSTSIYVILYIPALVFAFVMHCVKQNFQISQ